jgi:hypothetical protein
MGTFPVYRLLTTETGLGESDFFGFLEANQVDQGWSTNWVFDDADATGINDDHGPFDEGGNTTQSGYNAGNEGGGMHARLHLHWLACCH